MRPTNGRLKYYILAMFMLICVLPNVAWMAYVNHEINQMHESLQRSSHVLERTNGQLRNVAYTLHDDQLELMNLSMQIDARTEQIEDAIEGCHTAMRSGALIDGGYAQTAHQREP